MIFAPSVSPPVRRAFPKGHRGRSPASKRCLNDILQGMVPLFPSSRPNSAPAGSSSLGAIPSGVLFARFGAGLQKAGACPSEEKCGPFPASPGRPSGLSLSSGKGFRSSCPHHLITNILIQNKGVKIDDICSRNRAFFIMLRFSSRYKLVRTYGFSSFSPTRQKYGFYFNLIANSLALNKYFL